MATAWVVPLKPSANQQFKVALGPSTYRLTLRWNGQPDAGWIMDVADDTGNEVLNGLPLVTGCDLLAQFGYLGIPGQITVQTDHDPDAVPTFDNLGAGAYLYFVSPL